MSWDAAVEAFKKALPNYEERESQTALAHEIEAAFDANETLLGQAPPGVGKSYAVIVTLMDRARECNVPSVAATATKALQDQYIADCKMVRDNVFPEFRFTVLKGRGNYLCASKADKADEVLLGLPKTVDELTKLSEDPEINGDIERLGVEFTARQKKALTSSSDECPGKANCAFGEVCFAERAKAKAENSHVIIVSHAMLAIDATLRSQGINILPSYAHLAVDEAHELRGYVESALSTDLTRNSFTQLVGEVSNFVDDPEMSPASQIAYDPLFRQLDAILGPPNRNTGRTNPQPLTPAVVTEMADLITAAVKFTAEMEAKIRMREVYDTFEADRRKQLVRRVQTMVAKLAKVAVDPFADTVRWVEKDAPDPDRPGHPQPVRLRTAPLDVAPFLNTYIWSETRPVLVSATLAVGDDFGFVATEHGVDLRGPYRTFDCPSSFDFQTQATLYIPNGLPDLRNQPEQHLNVFNMQSLELIKAAGGRSMLLFTSLETLGKSYAELAPRLRDELGVTVYRQGDLGSTRLLADAFRDDETSVLFATKTFFTGLNIEGDSLTYLGIYKSPFHYPDVLWNARCEALNASVPERERAWRGSFPKLQIPDMTMTLIQAFGRLIRNKTDRGVVGIFDPSLAVSGGKRYGNTVRKALPPAPLVTDLRSAVAQLNTLREDMEARAEVDA